MSLSPQPPALSPLNSFFSAISKVQWLTAVCLLLTIGKAFAVAPIYYNPWDRVQVDSAEKACLRIIDYFDPTHYDWSFVAAYFQSDFDSRIPGANGNYFGGGCKMVHTNPQVGTGTFELEFEVFCPVGYIVVKKGSSAAQCITQEKILTLTPEPNQTDPRPAGTETKDAKSTYELIAKVTENGRPKQGVAVSFAVEVEANSGGHDHHDPSRPKGKVKVISPSSSTDANGEIKVQFQASQIAGTHFVAAACSTCTNTSVTKKVDVKVPDLVPFLVLPLSEVEWNPNGVGGTPQHRGNHFLTMAATFRMLEISSKFKKIWPDAPQLTLNDASLEWGGKFDIDGTWDTNPKKHAEHRIGDNIDIRANTRPGNVPSDIRKVVFRWLRDESTDEDKIPVGLKIRSVNPLHEGVGLPNEHFHLRLGN